MGFDLTQLTTDLKASFAGPPSTRDQSATEIAEAIDDNFTDEAVGFSSRVIAYRNTAQSIPDSTWTDVIFSTEAVDSDGEYDHTTGIFTAGSAGYYQVDWSVLSDSAAWAAGERWQTAASKNNLLTLGNLWTGLRWVWAAALTASAHSTGSNIIYLAASDTLRIKVFHDQGAAVNTFAGGIYVNLSIHRVS